MMDMSDAFGPELLDTFTVVRRVETMVLGRPSLAETPIPNVSGVVCVAGKNDIDRLPEGTRFSRGISVVTQTELRGAGVQGATTYQPDVIEWQGGRYLVVHVDIYKHAGSGFWQILAESMTAVEPV